MALKKKRKLYLKSTISVHIKKHKIKAVNGIGRHNERKQGQKHSNKNIDDTRTPDNVTLWGDGGRTTYQKRIEKIIKDNYTDKRKIRSDATMMVGITVNLGGDVVKADESDQVEILKTMCDWLMERYPHVISANIHMDETTPHLHLDIVPVTNDGRLSAKDIFSKGNLKKLQSESLAAVKEAYPEYRFQRQSRDDRVMNGLTVEQRQAWEEYKKEEEDRLEEIETELEDLENDLEADKQKLELEKQKNQEDIRLIQEAYHFNQKRSIELDKREESIRERSDELDIRQGEIDQATQKNASEELRLAQKERELKEREENTRKRSDELDIRQEEIDLVAKKNASEELRLARKEKELKEREESIRKRSDALDIRQGEIDQATQKNASEALRLARKEKELKEQETELKKAQENLKQLYNKILDRFNNGMMWLGSAIKQKAKQMLDQAEPVFKPIEKPAKIGSINRILDDFEFVMMQNPIDIDPGVQQKQQEIRQRQRMRDVNRLFGDLNLEESMRQLSDDSLSL